MDYSRRDLADRLAAEYALGTLRGPARRRFDNLLGAHPALRKAVAQWQERLEPMSTSVPPVEPPDRVWKSIETRLFAEHTPGGSSAAQRWWQDLGFWRGFSALASVVAVIALALALQAPEAQPPIVVVLGATPADAQAARAINASFVASVSADGRALVLRPLNEVVLTPGRALELWAVPAQGAPRSLGLVQGSSATTVLRTQLLKDVAAFAVSVEPAGGSTTGAPTGPIISVGKLQT
jgi:anti-sigma-K factor RskA